MKLDVGPVQGRLAGLRRGLWRVARLSWVVALGCGAPVLGGSAVEPRVDAEIAIPKTEEAGATERTRPEAGLSKSTFAVVREGAGIHRRVERDDGSRIMVLPRPARLRAVRRRGDVVEAVTALDERRHCTAGFEWLEGLALTVFVAEKDLASVTSRVVRIDRGEDTEVRVLAGHVVEQRDGVWEAEERIPARTELPSMSDPGSHSPAVDLRLGPIPEEAVGVFYEGNPEVEEARSRWQLDRSRSPEVVVFGDGATTGWLFPPVFWAVDEGPQGTRATLRTGCAEYRVAVPKEMVVENEVMHTTSAGEALTGIGVAEGSRVWWPDGEPAGVTTSVARFTQEVSREGDRVCLERRLLHPARPSSRRWDAQAKRWKTEQEDLGPLTLCFEVAALRPATEPEPELDFPIPPPP